MRKLRLKKTSVALLTAAILASGSMTAYAAQPFTYTKMGASIEETDPYTKSISCTAAYVKIKSASYPGGKTGFQVMDEKTYTAASEARELDNSDTDSNTIRYYGKNNTKNERGYDYPGKSFKAYLKIYDAGNAPNYSTVKGEWNPNG